MLIFSATNEVEEINMSLRMAADRALFDFAKMIDEEKELLMKQAIASKANVNIDLIDKDEGIGCGKSVIEPWSAALDKDAGK